MSHIIYLIGYSGTGKYTIAQELAKQGYIICDNQLINNPIFALLEYDGIKDILESGWDAIGKIHRIIMEFLGNIKDGNYVLNNELLDISHPNLLEIDVSALSATEVAERILKFAEGRNE